MLDITGNTHVGGVLVVTGSITSNSDISTTGTLEARVKSLQEKLEKSIRTVESDLEREKSISLDADLNEKRISKEKEELLKTENELVQVETSSSKELKDSKFKLESLQKVCHRKYRWKY